MVCKAIRFFIFSYIVIFGGLLILMNVAMFRMHRKFFKEYLQVTVLGAIRKEENLLNSSFLQPMSYSVRKFLVNVLFLASISMLVLIIIPIITFTWRIYSLMLLVLII